ncbi:GNAT family N-acetyltransferase [Streptomyces marincola]|uniref:N-acetyltransferase domain-containing protein n=1 Tax=Streptomyces marincola TaxID=2878388 RepID=A0A1W7CVB0_9ACTN|nr:hypothetical protein CAG99_07195 [Streptomyces marincola]
MSTEITRLDTPEGLLAHARELGVLLADVVADGASIGFVAPFGAEEAAAWWAARAPACGDGLTVWTARVGRLLVGTAGLVRAPQANGRHRAEVVKLMVHPGARGRGVAAALLATAEQAAWESGVKLLLLDTETGSAAEHLYRSAGWTKFGEVPDYAADPAGTLRASSFFHKSAESVAPSGGLRRGAGAARPGGPGGASVAAGGAEPGPLPPGAGPGRSVPGAAGGPRDGGEALGA